MRDRGVLSGGGSSQVVPRGGPALKEPAQLWRALVFDPSSPLDGDAAANSRAPMYVY